MNLNYLYFSFLSLSFVACTTRSVNNIEEKVHIDEISNDSTNGLNSGVIAFQADRKNLYASIEDTLSLNGLQLSIQEIEILEKPRTKENKKEKTDKEKTNAQQNALKIYNKIANQQAALSGASSVQGLKIYVTLNNASTVDTLEVPFVQIEEVKKNQYTPSDEYVNSSRFFYSLKNEMIAEKPILPNETLKGYFVVQIYDNPRIAYFWYKAKSKSLRNMMHPENVGEEIYTQEERYREGIYIKDYYLNKVKNR